MSCDILFLYLTQNTITLSGLTMILYQQIPAYLWLLMQLLSNHVFSDESGNRLGTARDASSDNTSFPRLCCVWFCLCLVLLCQCLSVSLPDALRSVVVSGCVQTQAAHAVSVR